MKIRLVAVIVVLIGVAVWSGCTSTGSLLSHNTTVVELSEPNFQVVAKNVRGESSAGYFLGVSYSIGYVTNSMALARVEGTAELYEQAIRNIWENFEASYGEIEGKKVALVNVRYDTDIINLLVYTKVRLILHADVVEFTE